MKRVLLVLALLSIATGASAVQYLGNPSFETGAYGPEWTNVGMDGPVTGPWFNGVMPYEGQWMGGAAASYGTKTGYVYQTFWDHYVPNEFKTISFWGHSWNTGGLYDTGVQLGIDPTGGTDPNSGDIIWADPVWATNEWEYREIKIPCREGWETVYVKSIQYWALEWNVITFDLVQVDQIPEPGSLLALGTGLVGLVGLALRRRK